MSSGLRTIIRLCAWVAVISYLIVAGSYSSQISTFENKCKQIKVDIHDPEQRFLDENSVIQTIDSLKLPIIGSSMDEIEFEYIESFLRSNPYIHEVMVYPSINGDCHVELTQRNVIFRVISNAGHDFFVDTSGYALNPDGQWQKKVPVFTTDSKLPFGTKDFGNLSCYLNDSTYYYLQKLSNFVNILEHDVYLKGLVTQIRITGVLSPGKEEVHLVPRIGKQVINLGNLDELDVKLKRLKIFYLKTLSDGWWQDARELCFQYGDKVIVKRKK